MNNLLRTLVYDNQVSLTVCDATAIAKEGVKLHALSKDAALVFSKTLAAMTFMSACLKNERGEISLAVKSDGACGDIGISGNRALHLRGYLYPTDAVGDEGSVFGENGALTIIRDDGYNMPFVGSCAIKNGSVDDSFEEYFAISEQLPTRFKTAVEFDEKGNLIFCGVAVLQPLPFADESTLERVDAFPLDCLLNDLKTLSLSACIEKYFEEKTSVWEERQARYQCNCSREYVSRVIVSLGKAQAQEIIKEEGALRVHCHYCNTDHEFNETDAEEIFEKAK